MGLPELSIPFEAPFVLPLLAHAPLVHFAMVLPIVVLIIEILNLMLKRRILSFLSLGFMFLMMMAFFMVYFSGKVDGSEAFDLLSLHGQEELKEHKSLGGLLVYVVFILFLFKSAIVVSQNSTLKAMFVLFMIGLLSLILLQGKHGGELVYEHGANNKLVSELDTNLTDAQAQVEELKATIESLNLKNKELNSSLTMAKEVNQTSIVEQNVTVPESNLTLDKNVTVR